jgi:DNA primase
MGGVQNVVAPQGTAFTGEHARILKRYVDEVVLCFDSDTAGQSAAVRVFDSLLASGLAIRVATVPAPHDPDSFIKAQGGPAFQKIIQEAPGFFDYYLDRLCATNDTRSDRGQAAVSRAMAEALHKTGNSVLLDRYAQKTALRLNVATEAIRLEFKKAASRAPTVAPTERETAPEVAREERPPSVHEFWLLKILLLHEDSVDWLKAHLDANWVQHSGVRHVIQLRFAVQEEERWSGPATLLAQVEEEGLRALLTQVLAEEKLPQNPEQQRGDIVLRLRNHAFDQEMAVLLRRLSTPGVSDEEHVALLRRQKELQAARLKPLSPR